MSTHAEQRAAERSASRLGAIMALYQMEAAGTTLDTIINEFEMHRFGTEVDGIDLPLGDDAFFEALLRGVVEYQVECDRAVNRILKQGWRLDRLDSILRAILRVGAFELMHRKDVPPKVSISEYVRLAEGYFDDEEVGFVNGVMDNLAKEFRGAELSA